MINEPYQTRPIRFLELFEPTGWKLKVYGIAYGRQLPRYELIESAKEVALRHLPDPRSKGQSGLGYLGVHDARKACFAFVGWWAEVYELNQYLFTASHNCPGELKLARSGLIGCTWDLHVLAFERQAWMSALLSSGGFNSDAYLAMRLNEDI